MWSASKKNAGEYSEEDTHRPDSLRPKAAALRTCWGHPAVGKEGTLQKET